MRTLLTAVLLCATFASALSGQEAAGLSAEPWSPTIPQELGDFRLQETHTDPNPAAGTQYRFVNEHGHDVDVFVYPVHPIQQEMDASAALHREVENFKQSLALGTEQGWYDRYEVVSTEPIRAVERAPGYAVNYLFARGGEVWMSSMYLFRLGDTYIKIRGSIRREDAEEADFIVFTGMLVSALVKQLPAADTPPT